MKKNIDPATCYTAYVVTNTRRAALQRPAYSRNTAEMGDLAGAHVFSTGSKASCCVRDILRSYDRDGLQRPTLRVTPILVQRRGAR